MVSTAFKGGMKSGGKMWLPAGSSPTAKMGVLDADGNPSIQPLGKKKGAEKGSITPGTPPEFYQIPVSYLKGASGKLDDAAVERRAQSIVDSGGLISPILVEQVDFKTYNVLPGSALDYAASIRAKQINPQVGEFANVFVVTKENRAAVQEQISLRSKPSDAELKAASRVTGGETKYLPYDTKTGVGYYQVPVKYLSPNVQEKYSEKKVDRMARAIVKSGGLVAPIVVQQESPSSYRILSGHFEYAAAMKAKGIDTKIGEFANVIIVPPDRTQAITGQLR
jgi:hypothetical protein